LAKFTFLDLAEEILKNSGTPLDVSTIWKRGVESNAVGKVGSDGKTPWITLAARLYVDSKDNSKSRFLRIGDNPVLFGLKELHAIQDVPEKIIKIDMSVKLKERNLHPLLAYFSKFYLNDAYVKTIYHEKSLKKSFNEWLHPDLVGVCFPDLHSDARALSAIAGELPFKLLSFELKRSLDFSNLRESFFQAVSNSSWAHQGYLVAANIKESPDFLGELKRLSGSFGIGVISLDIDSPDDSSVLYPAAERNNLDWDSINKLASENPDFSQFLRDVRIDLEGKKVHPSEYDRVEADIEKLKLLVSPAAKS
jgi:hypothetical protein